MNGLFGDERKENVQSALTILYPTTKELIKGVNYKNFTKEYQKMNFIKNGELEKNKHTPEISKDMKLAIDSPVLSLEKAVMQKDVKNLENALCRIYHYDSKNGYCIANSKAYESCELYNNILKILPEKEELKAEYAAFLLASKGFCNLVFLDDKNGKLFNLYKEFMPEHFQELADIHVSYGSGIYDNIQDYADELFSNLEKISNTYSLNPIVKAKLFANNLELRSEKEWKEISKYFPKEFEKTIDKECFDYFLAKNMLTHPSGNNSESFNNELVKITSKFEKDFLIISDKIVKEANELIISGGVRNRLDFCGLDESLMKSTNVLDGILCNINSTEHYIEPYKLPYAMFSYIVSDKLINPSKRLILDYPELFGTLHAEYPEFFQNAKKTINFDELKRETHERFNRYFLYLLENNFKLCESEFPQECKKPDILNVLKEKLRGWYLHWRNSIIKTKKAL